MPPETSTAVVKTDEKPMEFVPFGAQDSISLTIRQVQNLIAVKTKSGKTCSNNDAIKFMMMCHARKLNPYEGDAFLIGYDGKDGPQFSLITAHQAFLKRAEMHKSYDGMKSGIIVEDDGKMIDLEGDFYIEGQQKVVGGWATVFFKDRANPMHKRVRLKRFQKSWGIWQEDPAGMICKCAEADALRSSFPTMLGGLYTKEEMEHETDEPRVSKPIFAATDVISQVVVDPPKPETSKVLDDLRTLCAKDGIDEEFLTARLKEIGLLQTENLEDADDKTLEIVINSWGSLVPKLKEELI